MWRHQVKSAAIKAPWTRLVVIYLIQSLLIRYLDSSNGSTIIRDTSQVTSNRLTIQPPLKFSLKTSFSAAVTSLTANLWCVWPWMSVYLQWEMVFEVQSSSKTVSRKVFYRKRYYIGQKVCSSEPCAQSKSFQSFSVWFHACWYFLKTSLSEIPRWDALQMNLSTCCRKMALTRLRSCLMLWQVLW